MKCSEDKHEWKLVGVANNRQLGTNDRIMEKVEKIKRFASEATKITASQQMSTDDGTEVQSLRDAFQEREQELQQQVEEAQQQIQAVRIEAEVIYDLWALIINYNVMFLQFK